MPDTVPATTSVADLHQRLLTEIESGEGLSLSAAGRLFPGHRGGKSVDPSTTFRWSTKGVKTAGGEVVKLAAVRVGTRWLTSRSAVARFVAALTAAATPSAAAEVPARTPTQRRRAAERAASELTRRGA